MSAHIVIVGRPNVGKSTLFNRISRSRSALVDNLPGITRDRLHAAITHGDAEFELVDTGGFEELGRDPLSDKVREHVSRAISEADGVIFVVDARQGLMPGDEEIARLLRRSDKRIYLAVNKVDGPELEDLALDFYKLGLGRLHSLSAAHGYGVRDLMDDIASGLPNSRHAVHHERTIKVAVLGRPNTGKSSLINRILGMDRLLVSEVPGTTRDSVDTFFTFRDREYTFIDTAGIRRKARVKEKVEKFSAVKALESLKRSHIALILLDASEGISDQDARICGYAFEQGRAMVLGVNKWDLIKGDPGKRRLLDTEIMRRLKFVTFAPRINLSALTGEGVEKIFDEIDRVYKQYSKRIATPAVNKAVQSLLEKHPPPRIGAGSLKFYYATQVRSRPPTFVVFVNRPDMIHFSYERFLSNQMRTYFGLECTPLRLIFRKRS